MKSRNFLAVFVVFIFEFHIKCIHSWHVLSETRSIIGSSFLEGGGYKQAPVGSGLQSNSEKGSTNNNARSLLPVATEKVYDINSTLIDIKDGEHYFIQYLDKCVPILKYCLLTSLSSDVCSLACLLDQDRVGRHLVRVIQKTVKLLCDYVESVYDTGFAKFLKRSSEITRLTQFLKLNGIRQATFRGFATSGALALPLLLIKYAQSPILDILKPVIAQLEMTTNNDLGFKSRIAFENPSCYNVDLNDATTAIAEKIVHYPFVSDVCLGGWFVLSNIVYMNLKAELDIFDTVLYAMRLFTGVHCSLVQYAETGEATECETVSGKKWRGLDSHETSYKEICGFKEDQAPTDLHELFPDIFSKASKAAETFYDDEAETTTEANEETPNDDENTV